MTTIKSVPLYQFVAGTQTFLGMVEETLEGEPEERYLAEEACRAAYQTLRGWAADAAQVNTDWPGMSAAQKDTAMRETIRRLGLMLDRFADLLLLEYRS